MVIFPGYLSVFCRLVQTSLPDIFNEPNHPNSYKLSSVRELIASAAPVNSYAHLCATLKKHQPVHLSMTDEFLELLYSKHKIKVSDNQYRFLRSLIEVQHISTIPLPNFGGMNWGDVAEETNNFLNVHKRLLQIAATNCSEEFEELELDLDTEAYFEDPESTVSEYLREKYSSYEEDAYLDADEHSGVSRPDTAIAWKKWLSQPSIVALKDQLKRYGEWVNEYRLQAELGHGKFVITSFGHDQINALPGGPLKQRLTTLFGESAYLYTWQAARVPCGYGFDIDPSSSATKRLICVAIYTDEKWIEIGQAEGLSISGTSAADLEAIGIDHSPLGGSMVRVAWNHMTAAENRNKSKKARFVVTALTSVNVGHRWEHLTGDRTAITTTDLEAYLLAQVVKPMQFVGYIPTMDHCAAEGEGLAAQRQSTPFVSETTLALLPEDRQVFGCSANEIVTGMKPYVNPSLPFLSIPVKECSEVFDY